MKIKIITLTGFTDETSIQDWIDAHPNARLLGCAVSGLYCYIFYVE